METHHSRKPGCLPPFHLHNRKLSPLPLPLPRHGHLWLPRNVIPFKSNNSTWTMSTNILHQSSPSNSLWITFPTRYSCLSLAPIPPRWTTKNASIPPLIVWFPQHLKITRNVVRPQLLRWVELQQQTLSAEEWAWSVSIRPDQSLIIWQS